MITVQSSSLEGRVLHYLLEKYPVTEEELHDMLGIPMKKISLILRRLRTRGIITLEVLPDKTYVRLLRTDIKFIGVNPSQRQAIKEKGRGHRKKSNDSTTSDMMYG